MIDVWDSFALECLGPNKTSLQPARKNRQAVACLPGLDWFGLAYACVILSVFLAPSIENGDLLSFSPPTNYLRVSNTFYKFYTILHSLYLPIYLLLHV